MLLATLKDNTARMNERNIPKKTGYMNHQTADTNANASVFIFFSIAPKIQINLSVTIIFILFTNLSFGQVLL